MTIRISGMQLPGDAIFASVEYMLEVDGWLVIIVMCN